MARCASIDFGTIVHVVVGLGLALILMGHDTDATLVAEHEAAIAAQASRTQGMCTKISRVAPELFQVFDTDARVS